MARSFDDETHFPPRFSEQEMALILRRAAELQEGMDESPERSLAEIQEIAAEAGIEPSYVAAAAAEMRRPREAPGVLGAPTRFHSECLVPGELPSHALAAMVDCVRQHTGLHGDVTERLGIVEWRGRSPLGSILVTLAPRAGATCIGARVGRSDHAFVTAIVSVFFGATAALAGLMAATLLATSALVGSAMIAVCFLAGTVVSARILWRNAAERWRRRTRALVDAVAECAGRLAIGGEVHSPR